VGLVQKELRAAMGDSMFELLPQLVERAKAATIGLASHPLVASARLIGDMEAGWQKRDAGLMAAAISVAKAARVEKPVVQTYQRRHKSIALEGKLRRGLDGDTPLLLAAVEEAVLLKYDGSLYAEGLAAVAKFGNLVSTPSIFIDDTAAGARKWGSWRENPTWRLKVSRKTTVYVAVNEDGELNDEQRAKFDAKKQKAVARYEKARDRMAAAQAAAEADEKNDELAAAAKDAARVFNELEEARQRKAAREAEAEGDAFSSIGVHAVRNSQESWIPGVLSGYTTLAGDDDSYGDDQSYLAVEVDPDELPVYIVPSTWDPGEEGIFTLSVMADCEVALEEVPEFEGNMERFKGSWSTSNQGPRSKTNGDKETGKNFKVEKTWNKNPQYRVWLKDPETKEEIDEVNLQLVLSTSVEGAQMGIHVMRNAYCQTFNEKIEVLAERYQRLVGKTHKYEAVEPGFAPEISFELTLNADFEVKKNGCERGFPFFIVPSLFDKRMDGNFQLLIYSDKPVIIQMLDDAARKL